MLWIKPLPVDRPRVVKLSKRRRNLRKTSKSLKNSISRKRKILRTLLKIKVILDKKGLITWGGLMEKHSTKCISARLERYLGSKKGGLGHL